MSPNQVPSRVPNARMSGNFVVLRAGALRLLLPQHEVGAAEYAEHAPRAGCEPGVFEYGQGEDLRQVIALSEQMRPLAAFPAGRFVLARLPAGQDALSFAWDEVQVLIDPGLEWHALPAAMQVPGAPIEGYVERDGELLLCTNAERVVSYAVGAIG